jgi:hypothetical protein
MSEAAPSGSIVLDWSEGDLEEVEIRSDHRSTGNSHLGAAKTIPAILVATIVSTKSAGPSANECCDSEELVTGTTVMNVESHS